MESKKINQLATELAPELSDLTIIGDPTTGISKKITLSQMASLFTGTVEEYASLSAFPLVGTADTIYIALDTNILYRWNTGTSAYVELSPNVVSSLVFNDANGFDGTISLVGSVATLTITTALTTGSVGFIGASGALTQDNTNFFWDNSNKRLGIGTNAPTTAIDTFGSGIITRVNGTSTNNAFIGFASAGSNKWSIGNVQSDHRFRIYNEAATSELFTILPTGEIGIGIANPFANLHIDGGASVNRVIMDANINVAKIFSFRSDNSPRWALRVDGTESGSNAGANFAIRRYTDAGAFIDAPLTILRSSGYIGIGTSTPSYPFEVSNSGSGVTVGDFYVDTANNSVYVGRQSSTSGDNSKFYVRNRVNTLTALSVDPGGNGAVDVVGTFSVTRGVNLATSTGIVSIGTTPNTWNSSYKAIQIGASMSLLQDGSSTSSYWGGNLYVGTDGNYRYTINGTGGLFGIESGSIVYYGVASGTAGNVASLIERFNVGLSSSFKIYTPSGTSETLRLTCADSIGDGYMSYYRSTGVRKAYLGYGGSNDDVFSILQEENASLIFGTNGVERIRISSTSSGGFLKVSNTGNYFTASTTPSHEFKSDVNDDTMRFVNTNTSYSSSIIQARGSRGTTNSSWYFLQCYNDALGLNKLLIADSGNVTNTNGSYGSFSDIKLKENIIDTTPKLDKLLKVKIRNYNLIGDTQKQIGVIAQELEEVFPSMIDQSEDFQEIESFDEEGNKIVEKQSLGTFTKSVKYSVFVPILIKAMQEQQAQIEELKAKIK